MPSSPGAHESIRSCHSFAYTTRSALHRAALHGHEDAARVLMMAGSDVGSLDADKRGPLALAIR